MKILKGIVFGLLGDGKSYGLYTDDRKPAPVMLVSSQAYARIENELLLDKAVAP